MRNKTKTSIALSFLLFCAFAFQSCKDDETGGGNQPTQSISEYIASQGGYTEFISALDRAGLGSKISGNGAFTLLAVSDLQLTDDGIDLSAMTDDDVSDFIKYHFIEGKKMPSNFSNEGYVSSESKSAPNNEKLSLYTEVVGSSVEFNGIAATKNYEATNGMVYEVAGTLVPMTLIQHLEINPNMKNYASGVNLEASTKTALEGGPNTAFAINEKEMIVWLEDNGAIRMSSIKPSLRRTIMNNTLIYGKALGSASVTGVVSTEGEDLTATTNGGDIVLNGSAKVIKKNIYATNGVIHLIDGVIE